MHVTPLLRCLLVMVLALVQPPPSLAQAVPAPVFTYMGGDGSTIRKSIVIAGARNAPEGVAAELEWIRQHLPGATVESRGQVTGPPHYDVVTVKLATGALMDLHFDITAFHGK